MAHKHAHATKQGAPETRGHVIHWARLYELLTKLPGMSGAAIRRQTVDRADVRPGEKVLDIGCGPGALALLAKERAGPDGEVHGIDPSPEMINLARKKAAAGGGVRFQTGVAEELPFPDASFDLVLSSLMLHHLPDDLKPQALKEVARVLKPGGRLFAVDMSGGGPWYWRLVSAAIRHRLPKDYIQRLTGMMSAARLVPEVVESGQSQYAFIRARKKES
ncbi:MAG: methyltransferase domain-containing protein [Dehalococcoidia bacterium]|nr:methyltransferase domain-containing protein [Dehalococcoidia bacterium]